MPDSLCRISWLNPDVLAMSVRPNTGWTSLLTGFEQLSEHNPSGRPVNFLLELLGGASFSDRGRAENVAHFFLQFVPARTAFALVNASGDAATPGQADFLATVSAAGFDVHVFDSLDAAALWLSTRTPSCHRPARSCGPQCPDALDDACPARTPVPRAG